MRGFSRSCARCGPAGIARCWDERRDRFARQASPLNGPSNRMDPAMQESPACVVTDLRHEVPEPMWVGVKLR
jgi:hypothetical protein